ncbi:MAG TPA: APC family permease [Gemmatimonadales bacterium]|nr:APC family permease [Gemmatimonadales bacterium]
MDTLGSRVRRAVVGKPRNLADAGLFHRLALIPFLAWVGLGADGLSSSAYGPEEAFKALGQYPYLALPLAGVMAGTVLLISSAYSHIIEEFPSGGGGYVVATKLLGPGAGVTSGSALLVDYVLTITTSIAAAGAAIFSFVPPEWQSGRLGVEVGFIVFLTALNIRGVRESVLVLLPVFLLFILTHAVLIGGGILGHLPELRGTVQGVRDSYHSGSALLGMSGVMLLFLRAYSLGGGTYTGIEAVSNGLPVMREPRIRTGKRTMAYMALSLALTASGLLLCYLLWRVTPVPGKTMNTVLVERVTGGLPFGHAFSVVTIFAEGALLIVAAQAGFLDGPRVLANMAVDSWVPHRFASLSERLTTQNGIVLMGLAALAALLYTRGDVGHLIVMYSINVFLTFSLSMFAMLRFWIRERSRRPEAARRIVHFAAGFALCVTILAITLFEKFAEGGWVTALVTGVLITLCIVIRRHYDHASKQIDRLFQELGDLPLASEQSQGGSEVDRRGPVAVVLVASYGGVGIHTLLNVLRAFPGFFRGVVFVSVGVVDSGEFKGEHGVEDLRRRTQEMLDRYVHLARGLGLAATSRLGIGIEVVEEAERLCGEVAKEFARTTFFAGKMIFQRERWWQRLLHNETALALQKRLQWAGRTMVTMPLRVRGTP